MKVFSKISEIQSFLRTEKAKGKSIGFVPTMGALHEGHLQLLKSAKQENDISVCSIFVNPIQFNNKEDLKKYPRDINKDIEKMETVHCDILFSPEVEEMYPENIVNKTYDFGPLENVMEGKFRPGHFNGVAVVVKRLFDIVESNYAYFGEKDFQQLAVVNRLVEIENIPIIIKPCPTVRESDGLAMSSRNVRLTKKERSIANEIYQTLNNVKDRVISDPFRALEKEAIHYLNQVDGMKVEYFQIVDTESLQSVENYNESPGIVACVAVNLGAVRLIDNMRLKE